MKIGLLSIDETAYAGGVYEGDNENYYLNRRAFHWSGSPYGFYGYDAYEFYLGRTGVIFRSIVDSNETVVVPVINLKSDIFWTKGNGSESEPYELLVE